MPVSRETFNVVKNAQTELLTNVFFKLERECDILAQDEETRSTYLSLLADALCGIDRHYMFVLDYKNEKFTVGNLSYYLRDMAFFSFVDPAIHVMPLNLKGYGAPVDVPIENIWRSIRTSCYHAMADALTLAFTASTESFSGAMNAFEFGMTPIRDHRKKLAEEFNLGK